MCWDRDTLQELCKSGWLAGHDDIPGSWVQSYMRYGSLVAQSKVAKATKDQTSGARLHNRTPHKPSG